MKDKFVKIWYYIAGGLSAVSIIYFIIRMIINSIDPDLITSVYGVLDVLAIVFLSIAFVMLIAIIFIIRLFEAKEEKASKIKAQDAKRLEKYKKRRM